MFLRVAEVNEKRLIASLSLYYANVNIYKQAELTKNNV